MTVLQWAGPWEHSEIDGYFPHSLFLPLSECYSQIPIPPLSLTPVPNTNIKAFTFIEKQSCYLPVVEGLNCS